MKDIEIRKVANGYFVRPAYDGNHGRITDGGDVFVFETFEALVAFLKKTWEGE
jgi:hypothetical protein